MSSVEKVNMTMDQGRWWSLNLLFNCLLFGLAEALVLLKFCVDFFASKIENLELKGGPGIMSHMTIVVFKNLILTTETETVLKTNMFKCLKH